MSVLFILCFLGTGTDDKNLKSFSSYPDEVQTLIRNNEDYRAKVKTTNKCVAFLLNFLIFLVKLLDTVRVINSQNTTLLLLLYQTLKYNEKKNEESYQNVQQIS